MLTRAAHDPTEAPCAGDWCVLRAWPDHRLTLEHVLPRRTAVVRATAGKAAEGQVLCANVDLVGVVVALHPLPVESQASSVCSRWPGRAAPGRCVLLTKADLVSDGDEVAARTYAVSAPDVEVVQVSVGHGTGAGPRPRP